MESEPRKNDQEDLPTGTFETAKGSIYSYLPDGRIARHKTVTSEDIEPAEVMVFIPPWELIMEIAPKSILEKFENESEFQQAILQHVQDETGTFKAYLVDEAGQKLDSQNDLIATEQAFVCFTNNDTVEFMIPVSKVPKIDYQPFDTTKYKEGSSWKRRTHIGNKIVTMNIQ